MEIRAPFDSAVTPVENMDDWVDAFADALDRRGCGELYEAEDVDGVAHFHVQTADVTGALAIAHAVLTVFDLLEDAIALVEGINGPEGEPLPIELKSAFIRKDDGDSGDLRQPKRPIR